MIVIEAEPSEATAEFNAGAMVRSMLTRIENHASIPELARTGASQVYATDELGRVDPPARDFVQQAAGILAIPISRAR